MPAAAATSGNPTAFATNCWRRESSSRTRPAARDGGGSNDGLFDCSIVRLFDFEYAVESPPRKSNIRTFEHSNNVPQSSNLMIGYLQGTLRSLDTERAVVMAGGVGYVVSIPLSTYYKLEGKRDVELFVYTHVREDALALYGFSSEEEKFAFEKLISTSGIGPRLA